MVRINLPSFCLYPVFNSLGKKLNHRSLGGSRFLLLGMPFLATP